MNILVTGGAGFIGSNLIDGLLQKGYRIVAVDNFNPYYNPQYKRENIQPFLQNKKFTLIEGDIGDKKVLAKIFKENKFDKVIHLAASVGVRNSLKHPQAYYQNNVQATKLLLDKIIKHNISQFIFASSSSIYGNNSPSPFKEGKVVDSLLNPYALTKKQAEKTCFDYHQKYHLPITVFRFFTVYGPKGRPDMSPYVFTEAILRGNKLPLFGDGKARRDFTYVDDIVNGIILGLNKVFPFEVFNLGNSSPVDVISFIKKIEQITNKKAHIQNRPAFSSEMRETYADISKAKQKLNFGPKTNIEDGLKKFIFWFKKNRL